MAIVQYQSGEQGSETVDRISFLPKLLLHRILSFLPTREVVQTCVLAKSWRNIWCSIPSLEFHIDVSFDMEEEEYVGLRVVKFVDYVLLLRERADIQKFCLTFWSKIGDIARVNAWITHAIRHNVQVLDIKQNFSEEVELTPHIFTCKSLHELTIYSKKLNLPVSVCLPFLKFLELGDVIIKDGQLFEPLFSTSPSLETFILDHCQVECDQLTISAHQLKHLIMRRSLRNSVIISAPNLISVELGSCYGFRATISFDGQLICLSRATLDVKLKSSLGLVHLIHTVKNARYLKLLFASTLLSFFEELQKDVFILEMIQTPFNHLKQLMIGTCFFDVEIMFINHLLKQSPGVESVYLDDTIVHVEKNEHYGAKKVWFEYNMPNLKFVEFNGFRASKNEVRLVQFFLRNAINLEKLIIRIGWSNQFYPIDDKRMTNITKFLSTYRQQRSSACTKVHFVQP